MATPTRVPVLPGLFDPPIAASMSPLAKHCSSMGAQAAAQVADRQSLAILALYRSRGPQTDAEVEAALNIRRSSVNARRRVLIQLGLVDPQPKGTRKNAVTGISNSTWGLVEGTNHG